MQNPHSFHSSWLHQAVKSHSFLRTGLRWLGSNLPESIRENLSQRLLNLVLDSDFYLFDQLRNDTGLLLDVGANRGQSALSVLSRTKKFRVLSLEPNPAMRWSLMLVWLFHPWRFRFRMVGAAASAGGGELRIPLGQADLSTQASLDPAEFEKSYVAQRLLADGHIPGQYQTIQVRLLAIDQLALQPEVIKLDVEGYELHALEGMADTLDRYRPALIIELNNRERWAPLLQRQGYGFYTFDQGRLRHAADWRKLTGLNVICLHPQSSSVVSQCWLKLANEAIAQQGTSATMAKPEMNAAHLSRVLIHPEMQ